MWSNSTQTISGLKFENSSFNTGAVLQDAHMQRQKQLADTKEYLSSIQNKILDLSKFSGVEPKEVSNAFKGIAKFGLKVRAKQGMRFDKNPLPEEVQYETTDGDAPYIQKSDNNPHIDIPKFDLSAREKIKEQSPVFEPVNKVKDADLNDYKGAIRPSLHKYIRDNVKLSDVLPEISQLFDKADPVARQQLNPTLYTPYQVSFDDRIAENQGDFNAIEKTMSHNPAALGALAAQKYNVNNATRAEEFRTNQGISNDVNNRNVGAIDQAKEENLKLAEEQMVRQAQAKENTKANKFAAMNSISDKIAQNRRNNKTMQIEEGMYHYHLDKDGNAVYDGPKYQLPEERISMADVNPKDKTRTRKYPYDPEKDYTEDDSKMFGGAIGGHQMAGRWYGGASEDSDKKRKKHKKAKSF